MVNRFGGSRMVAALALGLSVALVGALPAHPRGSDREPGTPELVSVDDAGQPADRPVNNREERGFYPVDLANVTADGRFVVFTTHATNFVPADEPRDDFDEANDNVFVRDRLAGTTQRINRIAGRVLRTAHWASISADGRFVAFQANGTEGASSAGRCHELSGVFLVDRDGGAVVAVTPGQADDLAGCMGRPGVLPAVSASGTAVGFITRHDWRGTDPDWDADNVEFEQAFVYDVPGGTRELLTVDQSGEPAHGGHPADHGTHQVGLSGDGRRAVFVSNLFNLASGTDRESMYAYVRDRDAGTTEVVSVTDQGQPRAVDVTATDGSRGGASISEDGRHVVFVSTAADLTADDTDGTPHVFVRDLDAATTELVSVDETGEPLVAGGMRASISDDGRFVALVEIGHGRAWLHDRVAGTSTVVASPELYPDTFPHFGHHRQQPRLSAEGDFLATPWDAADGPQMYLLTLDDPGPGDPGPSDPGPEDPGPSDPGPADIDGAVINSDADMEAGLIASTRFYGQRRFATAALIATETWEQNDRAVIARHDEWPDALAGGYLAGVFEAPVLLLPPNATQDDTLAALDALGVRLITILGGTQAISEENEATLRHEHGYEVDRVSGPNRFETAAEIATEGGLVGEWDGQRTAFVSTATNFADALTAGPLAYSGSFPILLTPSQSLHPATERALQDLEIEQVILLGGQNAVAAEVEEEIRDAIEGDEDAVVRLSGPTRTDTAIEVAEFAVDELGFSPFQHGWARGNEFADALTIGPRLGEVGGPLLLIPTPTVVDSGTGANAEFAGEVGCRTASIDIPGGAAAMSLDVEDDLRGLLACPDEPLLLELGASPGTAPYHEWVDLTATVSANTGAPVEGVAVAFELTDRSEPSATVEFRADENSPGQPDAITVPTDQNGVARVQVMSDHPAEITVVASHQRADGVRMASGVEVSFAPR